MHRSTGTKGHFARNREMQEASDKMALYYTLRWERVGWISQTPARVKWAGEVKLLDQELNTVWFCLPVRLQEKEDYYISSLATFLFILSPNNVSGGSRRFPVHCVDQESASQAHKVWKLVFLSLIIKLMWYSGVSLLTHLLQYDSHCLKTFSFFYLRPQQ